MAADRTSERTLECKHYVGVDVGTGSARACILNDRGDIVGLASEDIQLWQPETGHYVGSRPGAIDDRHLAIIRGIGFDATCSLAVFSTDTDQPVSVTGPNFDNADGNECNVVLWLDHRPAEETKTINATGHHLLRYVGGKMNIEMEIPKVLWLKNNMPRQLFDRCRFYDLADALTHLATGNDSRSFCSVAPKEGYVPVGVDGSVKGWQEDFLTEIGLQDLCKDNFKRIGGVDGNGYYATAGELVGTLSPKAATEMGLPAGIAVGSGVIDAYAGWIGTVGAKVDWGGDTLRSDLPSDDVSQAFTRLAAVAGTSTCHLAMSEQPAFVDGVWGPYRDVVLPGYWLVEGGQSATGELLKHVVETHPAHHEARSLADAHRTHIYDWLNEHLRQMQHQHGAPTTSYLARHFFFYGDLFGNRSPIADPDMRGAVIGLSADKSVDGLALHYYGAMESIALQTRQIIEAMNRPGHAIRSIFISGSQCQNPVLMALMATVCDMPVVIPQYIHAAVVHGAAMLGVKAASTDEDGNSESLWSIMNRMSKPGTVVYPNEDQGEKRLLQAKYKVFLQQCEQQRKFRNDVDAAVAGWKK